MTHLMD